MFNLFFRSSEKKQELKQNWLFQSIKNMSETKQAPDQTTKKHKKKKKGTNIYCPFKLDDQVRVTSPQSSLYQKMVNC